MDTELMKERVNPKHAALLVVDVQNDFIHPEGALGKRFDTSMSINMVPRLQQLIDAARVAEAPIVFIRVEHSRWTNAASWVNRRGNAEDLPMCVAGSWGCEFYKVSPEVSDYVLTKRRYSAFQDTELDLVLRSLGVRTILCTGVGTNVCVESTARQGYMLDYHVVLVDDCCGGVSQELHNATLMNIRHAFGIVAGAHDVIDAWRVS